MQKCTTLIDPVVKCPYDNHLIAKSRLQKHIIKCEKRFPDHYKLMCPYDASHRLFKKELAEHIITCSARNAFKTEMQPEPRKCGSIDFDLYSDISSTIDCTENWDLKTNDDDSSTTLTEEKYSKDNNETSDITIDLTIPHGTFELKEAIEDFKPVRAPRGFSEAMLIETGEDSCVEDLESVVSSMGIGRGKVTWKSDKLKLIGLGRGRPVNSDS